MHPFTWTRKDPSGSFCERKKRYSSLRWMASKAPRDTRLLTAAYDVIVWGNYVPLGGETYLVGTARISAVNGVASLDRLNGAFYGNRRLLSQEVE